MADSLSIGVSALRAFQQALSVTSHNIANASTPGYSRQTVALATREAERYGGYYVGSGVNLTSIDRSYDALLATQMRDAITTSSRLDTYAAKAQSLNNLFADSSTGLSVSIQKYLNAVQSVANQPTSTASRQVMLSEAQGLSQRMQTYSTRLNDIDAEINSRIAGEVAAISSAADSIARLNRQIVSSQASGGTPNDLLDQRDQALADLAQHIGISVVTQQDGALNVFVGNGQSLVLGGNAATLVAAKDGYDPTRLTIAYQSGGNAVDMASAVSGGSLGGLMDVRRELLDPMRNQLGQIAAGLVDATNAQHREGMDLHGNLGGDLFTIGGAQVLPRSSNTGTAVLTATRADVGALTGGDYILQFDGSAWSARRAETGAAVTMTGTGTSGDPFVFDGVEAVVAGTAQSGDSFMIKPTAGAIAGMGVAISDPSLIAAAAPIRTSVTAGNAGTGTISAGEVTDVTHPQLQGTVAIQFLDAGHYSINGSGSYAYTAGSDIDLNGWRVSISGQPATGDSFTVSSNSGGTGDNRNMLALSGALNSGLLSGGAESVTGAVSRFVGSVGVAASRAQGSADAQQQLLQDVEASVQNTSGVNLDEEAANMLRYQQAYQAAAQIISITQQMFDSLLRATQR